MMGTGDRVCAHLHVCARDGLVLVRRVLAPTLLGRSRKGIHFYVFFDTKIIAASEGCLALRELYKLSGWDFCDPLVSGFSSSHHNSLSSQLLLFVHSWKIWEAYIFIFSSFIYVFSPSIIFCCAGAKVKLA